MPNKFDKSGMIHQWIYVIIPVQRAHETGHQVVPATFPLFCAFCKVCRTYFTESVSFVNGAYGSTLSSSSLPKYGCVLPDDVPIPVPVDEKLMES